MFIIILDGKTALTDAALLNRAARPETFTPLKKLHITSLWIQTKESQISKFSQK